MPLRLASNVGGHDRWTRTWERVAIERHNTGQYFQQLSEDQRGENGMFHGPLWGIGFFFQGMAESMPQCGHIVSLLRVCHYPSADEGQGFFVMIPCVRGVVPRKPQKNLVLHQVYFFGPPGFVRPRIISW